MGRSCGAGDESDPGQQLHYMRRPPPARYLATPATPFPRGPMSDEKLRTVIAEIEAELARAEGLSPTTRRSLEELVRDLSGLAERPAGAGPADGESLRERLSDAVRRLEASHPVLSTTLGNVVDALAFFGI